ncbi:hypothetical protein MRB53_011364 [Persea americana]|uniref:Uncharacterized protein n=1 Tax=Persea americana TaxID=3435 RepID=A0ACC2LW15_PERAE|nr:hypothetical protein MRB53_011364 [Persea americana]
MGGACRNGGYPFHILGQDRNQKAKHIRGFLDNSYSSQIALRLGHHTNLIALHSCSLKILTVVCSSCWVIWVHHYADTAKCSLLPTLGSLREQPRHWITGTEHLLDRTLACRCQKKMRWKQLN